MNAAAQAPLPMTDLGRLLHGQDAASNLVRLHRALEDEILKVRKKMSVGLNQADYVYASKRVNALANAQVVLKSLQIYLAH
jgi:hypothetical protein